MRLFYGAYEFPRTPAITQEIAYNAEEGENTTKTESWTIAGSLVPAVCGHAQVWALIDALLTAIEVDSGTFSIREDDGVTVVYEITAADCIEGPRFTSHRIVDPRKGFLLNNAQYELRMECIKPIEDQKEVSRTLEVNFSYDIFGILTVNERGEILYKQEHDITEVPASIFTFSSTNWSRQQQFTYSDDKQKLSYTYVYAQKSLAVPAALDALGVETWNVSVSSKTGSTGTPEYTISGSCKLRGAGTVEVPLNTELSGRDIVSPEGMAFSSTDDEVLGSVGATLYGNMEQLIYFIENELLGENVAITDREIRTDPTSRAVSFSFTYNLPGSSGGQSGGVAGVEFSYSWNYSGNEMGVNEVKRLGKCPYIQELYKTAPKSSESGTLQSRSSYPEPPVHIDGLILIGHNVDYTPTFDGAGNAIYQTSFRYSYYYQEASVIMRQRARELFEKYGKTKRRRQQVPRKEELYRRTIGF